RTVHLHGGPVLAWTARVNHVRDELLADAGLAFNEHAGRRLRDSLEAREHLPERRALADDAPPVPPPSHFLSQVVALALELRAQPRVLFERRAQLALGAIARRDVFGSDEQRGDGAARIAIGGCRNFDLEHLAGLRDVRARLVL